MPIPKPGMGHQPVPSSAPISQPGAKSMPAPEPAVPIESNMQVNFQVNMDNLPGPDYDSDGGLEEIHGSRSNVEFNLDDVASKLSQLQFSSNFNNVDNGEGAISNMPPSSSVPCNTMLSDSDDDEIEGADILND